MTQPDLPSSPLGAAPGTTRAGQLPSRATPPWTSLTLGRDPRRGSPRTELQRALVRAGARAVSGPGGAAP